MIKSIVLKNFMSHKDSYLELDPGLNVITGDNEAGKSNVLRGIDWIVNNRPSGDSMCSHWGGETMAGVIVDGKLVQRYRLENGQNLYTITHENGEEEEFRAFGKGVPYEIHKLLNIRPVNMHSQMDGPFLLNQSPADVARYFNEIVNLDVIDRAIKGITKILNTDRDDLARTEAREGQLRDSVSEYDWLGEAEGCVVKLEATQKQLRSLDRDIADLAHLTGLVLELEEELLSFNEIIQHEENILRLEYHRQMANTLAADCHDLDRLVTRTYELQLEEAKCQDVLAFEDELDILLEMEDEVKKGDEEILELQRLMNRQMQLQGRLEEYTIKLQDLKLLWDKLMPDTCPLCDK